MHKQNDILLFGLGAALGSALGIVLGSILTFWIGSGTLRAIQRVLRRLMNGDQPNFEALLQ